MGKYRTENEEIEVVPVKKGQWSRDEDTKLISYIMRNGHGCWLSLPAKAGLQRCGKSCRLRWRNYLRPDIKRGNFSLKEEETIVKFHALLGNRWSAIAAHLPMRTDNEIKNHFNTHLKKRLTKMGIDPLTHKPISSCKARANLDHRAQWESVRIQAEERLVRDSLLHSSTNGAISFKPTLHLDVLKPWHGSGATDCPASTLDHMVPDLHTSFGLSGIDYHTSNAMQNEWVCSNQYNDVTQEPGDLFVGNLSNSMGPVDNMVGGFQDICNGVIYAMDSPFLDLDLIQHQHLLDYELTS